MSFVYNRNRFPGSGLFVYLFLVESVNNFVLLANNLNVSGVLLCPGRKSKTAISLSKNSTDPIPFHFKLQLPVLYPNYKNSSSRGSILLQISVNLYGQSS